jgi:hypothetical protein
MFRVMVAIHPPTIDMNTIDSIDLMCHDNIAY